MTTSNVRIDSGNTNSPMCDGENPFFLIERFFLRVVCFVLVLGLSGPTVFGQPSVSKIRAKMVRRIDRLVTAKRSQLWIAAAPKATDAEFLRRLYLDLTGSIPRVSQARDFLQDKSPNKRDKLIDQLLASPGYATHMADTWRNIMLPGGVSVEQVQNLSGLQNWLRRQFVENLRYDRLVADLLVSKSGDVGPALFFTALELKPEKLAARTSRIFLGLQIECAQCHDHPFDKWTKRDFWGGRFLFRPSETANESGRWSECSVGRRGRRRSNASQHGKGGFAEIPWRQPAKK